MFNSASQSIIEQDRNFIWHPFTQEKIADLPIVIEEAKGAYLYGQDGAKYFDAISSWWVNLHGHSHPYIANAIYQQALKLEQVIFAGFTHKPAVELISRLSLLLPPDVERGFFSDNGSSAVEVALKISHQYWWNQGDKQRNIFLSFEGDYHGDTVGAMSVGKGSGFFHPFEDLLCEVKLISYPATWYDDNDVEKKEAKSLDQLSELLKSYGNRISAFIIEPLIQGASGMRIARPEFFRKAYDLVKEYNILVIFDEVMTGFGRTGTLFAYEQIDRIPDLLCLSKGLTGGFLPLSLTMVKQNIYNAFLSDELIKAFLHGHSYTANPLGCAAALASLDLLLKNETNNARQTIASAHQLGREIICSLSAVKNYRTLGTIAAFDVNLSQQEQMVWNRDFKRKSLSCGLLLRPLGNSVYILPPYCTTAEELVNIYQVCKNILFEQGFC